MLELLTMISGWLLDVNSGEFDFARVTVKSEVQMNVEVVGLYLENLELEPQVLSNSLASLSHDTPSNPTQHLQWGINTIGRKIRDESYLYDTGPPVLHH